MREGTSREFTAIACPPALMITAAAAINSIGYLSEEHSFYWAWYR
ncbi:hypothetical protein PS726_03691 [Pseudomonas fluorescens]|nr:hypothetical protein PS726_03691 [Pseudomonas fluorescens]